MPRLAALHNTRRLRRAGVKTVRAAIAISERRAFTTHATGFQHPRYDWRGLQMTSVTTMAALGLLAGTVGILSADGFDRAEETQERPTMVSPEGQANLGEFYVMEKQTELGRGQFGLVRKAMDKVTGEAVAVKSVPRCKASEAHFWEEIESHRRASHHPNVVDIKGVYQDDDYWYIVMELADGGELYDVLVTDTPMKDNQVRSFLRQMVDAVAYIHDRGIVHFDIKPENILLSEEVQEAVTADPIGIEEDLSNGAPRNKRTMKSLLADFGSSFKLEGNLGARDLKEYTAAYSAPEVVSEGEVDSKADIWSLGVIAYIMIKGHHPFDPNSDADEEEVVANVMCSDLDYHGVSPQASGLLRSMLSKDPADRPTAREILQNSWLRVQQE